MAIKGAIRINDIATETAKALQEYTQDVTEGMEKAKEEVAKETVQRLKNTSPELTGDYRKGWKKIKQGSAQVIHNKTEYRLTHLLEHGHAKRDGGRTKAIPHIRPAEEEAIRDYESRVEKVIKG